MMMSATYDRTLREQNEELPVLRDRFQRIKRTWGDSIVNFCLIYMFFLGLLFISNLFLNVLPKTLGWAIWGTSTLAFFGLLFMALAIYGALYPERGAGLLATFVLSCVGILTSTLVQFSPVGILFWILALVAALYETVRRVTKMGRR